MIIEIHIPYHPSVEAARFDLENATMDMEAASLTFAVAPNDTRIEAGEYYRSMRARFHRAREILHDVNFAEMRLRMERGGK